MIKDYKYYLPRLFIKLRHLNIVLFVLLFTFLCKLFSIIIGGTVSVFAKDLGMKVIPNTDSWQEEVLYGVILAPLVETMIFQVIIFGLLSAIKFTRDKKIAIVIISGVIFGLAHCYNTIYVIAMIPAGMLLMTAYILRLKNNDSFLCVSFIHLLSNLIVLAIKLLR